MSSLPILSAFYLPSHRCKKKSRFRVKKLVKSDLVMTTTFAKETEFPATKEYAISRERAFCKLPFWLHMESLGRKGPGVRGAPVGQGR